MQARFAPKLNTPWLLWVVVLFEGTYSINAVICSPLDAIDAIDFSIQLSLSLLLLIISVSLSRLQRWAWWAMLTISWIAILAHIGTLAFDAYFSYDPQQTSDFTQWQATEHVLRNLGWILYTAAVLKVLQSERVSVLFASNSSIQRILHKLR